MPSTVLTARSRARRTRTRDRAVRRRRRSSLDHAERPQLHDWINEIALPRHDVLDVLVRSARLVERVGALRTHQTDPLRGHLGLYVNSDVRLAHRVPSELPPGSVR